MDTMLDHYIEMMNMHLQPGTWHGKEIIMCNRIGDNPTVVDTWCALKRHLLKMSAQQVARAEAAEAAEALVAELQSQQDGWMDRAFAAEAEAVHVSMQRDAASLENRRLRDEVAAANERVRNAQAEVARLREWIIAACNHDHSLMPPAGIEIAHRVSR